MINRSNSSRAIPPPDKGQFQCTVHDEIYGQQFIEIDDDRRHWLTCKCARFACAATAIYCSWQRDKRVLHFPTGLFCTGRCSHSVSVWGCFLFAYSRPTPISADKGSILIRAQYAGRIMFDYLRAEYHAEISFNEHHAKQMYGRCTDNDWIPINFYVFFSFHFSPVRALATEASAQRSDDASKRKRAASSPPKSSTWAPTVAIHRHHRCWTPHDKRLPFCDKLWVIRISVSSRFAFVIMCAPSRVRCSHCVGFFDALPYQFNVYLTVFFCIFFWIRFDNSRAARCFRVGRIHFPGIRAMPKWWIIRLSDVSCHTIGKEDALHYAVSVKCLPCSFLVHDVQFLISFVSTIF